MDGDMVLGDANAPITFIEYSSLSCPHCARHHKDGAAGDQEATISTPAR